MNLRLFTFCPRATIGLLGGLLAWVPVGAQPAGTVPTPAVPRPTPTTAATLPKLSPPSEAVKTSEAPTAAENESVNRFIREATAILGEGKETDAAAAAAALARNELINASISAKGASIAYLTNYLNTLSSELAK